MTTTEPASAGLSDLERAVLDLEHELRDARYAGAKETAVRERLGMTATRYYQVLNALLERREALEEYPQVVALRRRQMAARARRRA